MSNIVMIDKIKVSQNKADRFSETLTTKIGFADNSAWLVAKGVKDIVDRVAVNWDVYKEDVGVILMSNLPPLKPSQMVSQNLSKGCVSPISFVASNAGAPIAAICSTFGFHGPTLNLTSTLSESLPISYILATQWLEKELARYVFLTSWGMDDDMIFATILLLTLASNTDTKELLNKNQLEEAFLMR